MNWITPGRCSGSDGQADPLRRLVHVGAQLLGVVGCSAIAPLPAGGYRASLHANVRGPFRSLELSQACGGKPEQPSAARGPQRVHHVVQRGRRRAEQAGQHAPSTERRHTCPTFTLHRAGHRLEHTGQISQSGCVAAAGRRARNVAA